MIRPSPELLAVARRWFRAVIARPDGQLRHFMSKGDVLRFIGTAEDETWGGPVVREAIDAHFQEIPAVLKYEELFAEAHEKDGIGWTFFVNRFWFETRPDPITFHSTLVFVLEDNVWRIVQRHASVPSSNLETTGHEHSAIQSLIAAARDEFRLDQREGMASVMFTDIANSSAIAEVLGDRVWAASVADHFDRVGAVIAAQGGQLVKSLGDGTMSSFASARAALGAAIAIQRQNAAAECEPPLTLRSGIHTGDVIQTRDDFFGTVVNKAARVAAAAGPDEIRVSEATRLMAGSAQGLRFADPMTVTLKGLEGDHLIHTLDWQP